MQKSTRKNERRGITLVLVLGMLFLFSGVALTFSLLARNESQAARNFKRATLTGFTDTGAGVDSPPMPHMLELLSQVIFDTNKTNSALRGHSLLRDMYGGNEADPRGHNLAGSSNPGWQATYSAGGQYSVSLGGALYTDTPPGQLAIKNYWRNAFNGMGIPPAARDATGEYSLPIWIGALPTGWPPVTAPPARNLELISALRAPFGETTVDNLFPFNFMQFDNTHRTGFALPNYTNRVPEKYNTPSGIMYSGYDEDYDYPDWNNMFLAMERPDGTVIIPSYHRPQLVRDLELRGAFNTWPNNTPSASDPVGTAWAHPQGWRVILRPRRAEYAGGPAMTYAPQAPGIADAQRSTNGTGFNTNYNNWKDLADEDGSGAIGDSPAELDVDTDGDGIKDAIWVDFGADPIQIGTDWIKPLAAIKIVDLAGRIPLNTAGNMVLGAGNRGHSSNTGASVAEINPKHAHLFDADTAAHWNAAAEYKKLFYGDPLYGASGKYTAASGGTPGTVDGPGVTAMDDPGTQGPGSPAPTPPSAATNRFRTPVPVPLPQAISGNQLYQDYPAGLIEALWVGRYLYGYDNTNEYATLGIPPAGGAIAPNTRAGSYFYGQRDNDGRGMYLAPGWPQSPNATYYPTPAGQALGAFGRDIVGLFCNYDWTLLRPIAGAPINPGLDDPAEYYPYESPPVTDSQFGEALLEPFLRPNDTDASTFNYELSQILRVSVDPQDSTKNFAGIRTRRMFTTTTWDLMHYSAPPAFAPAVTPGVAFPNDPTGYDTMSSHSGVYTDPAIPNQAAARVNGRFDAAIPVDVSGPLPIAPGTRAPHAIAAPMTTPAVPAGTGSLPLPNGVAYSDVTPVQAGTPPYIVCPVQKLPTSSPPNSNFGIFHPAALNPAWVKQLNEPPYSGIYSLYPQELIEGKRFNLNRPLRRYREADRTIAYDINNVMNVGAEVDRQIMAAQIYMILRIATHTQDDPSYPAGARTNRIRQLAQLAVNIVDYMDPDEVITRFNFDPNLKDDQWAPPANEVVYGFELPQLVISEGSVMQFTKAAPSTDTTTFFFCELSNPWPAAAQGQTAILNADDEMQIGLQTGIAVIEDQTLRDHRKLAYNWQLEIEHSGGTILGPINFIDGAQGYATTVDDTQVAPGNFNATGSKKRGRLIRGKNNTLIDSNRDDWSYYVVGPDPSICLSTDCDTFFDSQTFDVTMDVDFRLADNIGKVTKAGGPLTGPFRFRLKRLRNPYEVMDPTYNPYIIIDEWDVSTLGGFNNCGQIGASLTTPSSRLTIQKQHPWVRQYYTVPLLPGPPPPNQPPRHTLSYRNTLLQLDPFPAAPIPIVHRNKNEPASAGPGYVHFLNRPLATPLELLFVRMFGCGTNLTDISIVTPDLTSPRLNFLQMFGGDSTIQPSSPVMSGQDPNGFSGLAAWFVDAMNDGSAALGDLYRFFEFVETPSRLRGAGATWRPHNDPQADSTVAPTNPIDRYDFLYPDFRADRVAGKINLNAITAEEVFRALFDTDEANPPNTFLSSYTAPRTFPFTAPLAPLAADIQFSGTPPGNWPFRMPFAQIFSRQFPTDATGQLIGAGGRLEAGALPTSLVDSEMFKRFLQSLAGQDQTLGTLDDLPFRSFAQRSIADTLLRPSADVGNAAAWKALYVSDNVTTLPVPTITSGNLRRLFDGRDPAQLLPVPMPNGEVYERMRLLAKIAGNTTTRGMTFAGWMTIGWFKVIPGTETDSVPQLDEEMGASTGGNIRHRAFFIVDRSLATGYTGPKTVQNPANEPVIKYFRLIE